MAIKCCRYCVPPKRHATCHATCEQYIKEKQEDREERAIDHEIAKLTKPYVLKKFDFDKITYLDQRKRK